MHRPQLGDGRDALAAKRRVGARPVMVSVKVIAPAWAVTISSRGRLGDHRRVAQCTRPDRRQHAGPAVLLAGHGHQHRLAVQLDAGLAQRAHRGEAGHDAALHVARAAAVQRRRPRSGAKRRRRPLQLVARADHVDVPGDQHPSPGRRRRAGRRPAAVRVAGGLHARGSRDRLRARPGRRRRARPRGPRSSSAARPRSAPPPRCRSGSGSPPAPPDRRRSGRDRRPPTAASSAGVRSFIRAGPGGSGTSARRCR